MSAQHLSMYERMELSTRVVFGGVEAAPIAWRCGIAEEIAVNDVEGFAFVPAEDDHAGPWLDAEGLPTEFFNHQLMEIDPGDRDALKSFIETWGMPFSPLRNDGWLWLLTDTLPEFSNERLKAAVASSGLLNQACFSDEPTLRSTTGGAFDSQPISVAEATQTIKLLQHCVRCLRAVASGHAAMAADDGTPSVESLFVGVFSTASCNPCRIDGPHVADHGLEWAGLLTSAIANQVIETCASPEPWRLCVQCGTPFKLRQSPRAKRPQRDSVICCQRCNNNRQSDKFRGKTRR